jgi:hypothetical protein
MPKCEQAEPQLCVVILAAMGFKKSIEARGEHVAHTGSSKVTVALVDAKPSAPMSL